MALKLQIEYDGMDNIAAMLSRMGDDVNQLMQKIDGDVSQLSGGGWKGVGAEAFFQEMEQVRRQLMKLQEDFEKQQKKINETSQHYQDIEQEILSLFSSL